MFRRIRNLIGNARRYGNCPNCGDSWNWKQMGNVSYEEYDNGSARGVALCTECLTNPAYLDVDRIARKLAKCGWQETSIQRVRCALTNAKRRTA